MSAYTVPVSNLVDYRPWLFSRPGKQLQGNGKSSSECHWQQIEVLAVRPHKQGFVAQLEGIDDRTAADRLKGYLIGVPADRLPAPDTDEFYWRDLIGMEVWDQQGECLGRVANMLETGADDVLVIKSDQHETLIPFHRQYVLSVDATSRRISVDWESL